MSFIFMSATGMFFLIYGLGTIYHSKASQKVIGLPSNSFSLGQAELDALLKQYGNGRTIRRTTT